MDKRAQTFISVPAPMVRHTTPVPQVPLHGIHTSPLLSPLFQSVCACTTFSVGLSLLPLETIVAPSAIHRLRRKCHLWQAGITLLQFRCINLLYHTFCRLFMLGDCTITLRECHFLFCCVCRRLPAGPQSRQPRLCCN